MRHALALGSEGVHGAGLVLPLSPHQVLSRNDSTGAQGYKRVVRLFRGETNRVVHLRIAKAASVQRGRSQRHRVGQGKGGSSSDGEEGSEPARPEQTLRCTTEHPFWVQGRGWVAAGKLRVGDELSGSQGERLVVSGHEVREEHAKHYNFEVEDWDTYFVSETEDAPAAWAHNKCPPLGKELGDPDFPGASAQVFVHGEDPNLVVKLYRSNDPDLMFPPEHASREAMSEHLQIEKMRGILGDAHVARSRLPEEGFLIKERVFQSDALPTGGTDGFLPLAEKLGNRLEAGDAYVHRNWIFGRTADNPIDRWVFVDIP